jgi:hypothetical protein
MKLLSGGWKTFHNENIPNLHSTQNVRSFKDAQMKKCEMGMKKSMHNFSKKPDWNRSLRKPRSRWEYNVKMDL